MEIILFNDISLSHFKTALELYLARREPRKRVMVRTFFEPRNGLLDNILIHTFGFVIESDPFITKITMCIWKSLTNRAATTLTLKYLISLG